MKRNRKMPLLEEDVGQPPIPPSMLLEIFDEPIAVQRWAVRATGSITAAAMMTYALQVSQQIGADQDGWFAKTIKGWEESVGLSRSEQETARARLVELGLLEERRVGMPAHLEFRVNQEVVYNTIAKQAERFSQVDQREEALMKGNGFPSRQHVPPLCAFPPSAQDNPWA